MLTETETSIDPRLFHRLCEMVYDHCGITLHDGKQELVRARVSRQLRTLGQNMTASQYLSQVMDDPAGEEFAGLIDALSTNLTSFFRESAHFTFLEQKLIPETAARKRKDGRLRLRAWSAACSTGEEPYSIMMTMNEALAGQGQWDVKLLATDISRNVLRTAINGTYDIDRVRSVPPPLRSKYFTPAPRSGTGAERAKVADAIRNNVVFNYLNLIETWPFSGPFDFIFCRNVMIYFDKQTQEKLVNRFWDCLESGGILFTGHSESLTGIRHKFRYVQPTIYAKP